MGIFLADIIPFLTSDYNLHKLQLKPPRCTLCKLRITSVFPQRKLSLS